MNSRLLCLAMLCVGVHGLAHAQLNKCKGPNGNIVIQDKPCGPDPKADERKMPKIGDKDPHYLDRKTYDGPAPYSEPRPPTPPASNWPPTQAAAPSSNKSQSAEPLTWQQQEAASKQRRAEQEQRANSEQAKSGNRMRDCNEARQQLGVVKTPRPVFSYDNNGNRVYMEDKNRDGEIAAAQRRVNASCT